MIYKIQIIFKVVLLLNMQKFTYFIFNPYLINLSILLIKVPDISSFYSLISKLHKHVKHIRR